MIYPNPAVGRQGFFSRLGILLLFLSLLVMGFCIPVHALPQGDAITDSRTILRRTLPIGESTLQHLDDTIIGVKDDLKYKRWSTARSHLRDASSLLARKKDQLLSELAAGNRASAADTIDHLQEDLNQMQEQLKLKSRGKAEALDYFELALAKLESLESNWVQDFPYSIPEQYEQLPRLLGRAQVEMKTTAGRMVMTLDGYSAPITAGNFADLVQKGFYDDLPIDRVETFYVIQAGDPPGDADGYMDPETGKKRTIPLEIRVQGETKPYYGDTLANLGLWDQEPALPFSAAGTVAMARYPDDPNSASSQFFIFIAEPDLTPAGLNLMDGRFAAFGYITDGLEVMYDIKPEDRILSARLISGQDNLILPTA
ncbi:MAG: peptidylprolyl isomerase [Synechococcaceae cyanobacterium SM2_3_1]|nr:peptidylprolyl isomerase [Synechococcaceae cyanobacterium SM2_3_1]